MKTVWIKSNWIERIVLVSLMICIISMGIACIFDSIGLICMTISGIAFLVCMGTAFVVADIVDERKKKRERIATNHKTTLGMYSE